MTPRHLPAAILRSAAAAILLAASALAAPELSIHRPMGKAIAAPLPEAAWSLGALRFQQVDAEGAARFSARAGAGRVTLDPRGVSFGDADAASNVRMNFAGSRPSTRLIGEQRLRSTASSFVGNDPSRWRHDVAEYSRVRYEGVYPAVDAVVYDAGRGLEYDFVVAPGGNPAAIRLAFDGASSVRIDLSGALLVEATHGKVVRHAPPVAFQEVDGVRRAVAARFVAREGGFGFETSAYDRGATLVIDPTIDFSTLYGAGQDFASDVAVDAAGNAYVVGLTIQDHFPVTRDPGQVTSPIPGFLYKVSPSGELLFSIVFGGDGTDDPRAVVIDPDGNPVVVGGTSSVNFPLVDAFQTTGNWSSSAFVTKFSSDGSRILFSTLFGGTGLSGAFDVECRPGGRIYVSGSANEGLLLVNAADSTQVKQDLFVALLDTSAHRVVFSTYLGGSEDENSASVAVDPSGAAYIFGSTRSPDFPTANAYQPGLRGCCDHVVTKLSPRGEIVYSTYLGGDLGEGSYGNIAVKADGSAVVFGTSLSSNFPTVNALFGPSPEPFDTDAVLAELTPDGDGLVFSTYLGGDGLEEAYGLEVDAAGTIWVAGRTQSSDFPLVYELNCNRT
ncbi:MAG: SBBP repeat-containing protein [Blastocatellia bacterium]|nr:SBBP repeat-containing protein [Blastocatellia bacterium]